MSIINSNLLLGAPTGGGGGNGYEISRSLRFNPADTTYLGRTPSVAGNRKTWTWAGWVKKSAWGPAFRALFSAEINNHECTLRFMHPLSDSIEIYHYTGSGFDWILSAKRAFRDPSAWCHIVAAFDSTQAISSNRVKLYVNGIQLTDFSASTYPASNYEDNVSSTTTHSIGTVTSQQQHFEGYLADIHFIDGQALDASAFGEFSAATGVWTPKAYAGTYGTNGFHLDFSDNSSIAALGKDSSGRGNNWTPHNFSVTPGAGNDSLVDVPTNGVTTNADTGGKVRGNYCTLNPLKKAAGYTLSNGNLDISGSGENLGCVGTIGFSSGKWYWEVTVNSESDSNMHALGVTSNTSSLTDAYAGSTATNGWGWRISGGVLKTAATITVNSGPTGYTAGDILQIAFDADNGKVWLGKNSSWTAGGDPAAGSGQTLTYGASQAPYFPVTRAHGGSITFNFGQRPFAFPVPAGFKSLNTANLPAPVVTKPSDVFTAITYTGNGNTSPGQLVTTGFSPDFVWIKERSTPEWHQLYDALRGANVLFSNATDSEANIDGASLASNGFYAKDQFRTNENSQVYAAWTWDAGSSTVTNTQGSISSQVRANASAGFSIVSFAVPSSGNFTVGHGLGITPSLIITKGRGTVDNWVVFHSSVVTATNQFLRLNTSEALLSASNLWGAALPNSTVFGGLAGIILNPSQAAIAYCFAPVAGYSAFGSYTGNGNADGPFVFCGFRPRYLLIKNTSAAQNWIIMDTARSTYNVSQTGLTANLTDPEFTQAFANTDFLSNGFKIRTTDTGWNASGATYIYAAFAESPFQYARAR